MKKLIALALVIGLGLMALVYSVRYPVEILSRAPADSVRILDREGRMLREAVNGEGERVAWTGLDRISPLVVDATIAVEDARFRRHPGVDLLATVRAAGQNVWHRRVVSGASTLTMQLARMLAPHERSLAGKLGEMVDALRLERELTKEMILEQYLNRAPYGAGAIGVEAASLRYFGKPSLHLSLAEAALLAGLPQSPTRLNPLKSLDAARVRQRKVIERMGEEGLATEDDVRRALAEPVSLARRARDLRAPHFTDLVLSRDPPPGDVTTTLDLDLQSEIERAVEEHVRTHGARGLTNASVVVLDNTHCDILAMVGSANYDEPRSGAVNGAVARRQPGSTLKPFTYALAFEQGSTPASVVADVPTRYGDPEGVLFRPKNFNGEFFGPILMGEALARSLNVPAIRVANLVGPQALLDRLHQIGFDSLDAPAAHYGLGLTLGNGEVTLVELAEAYAMFARSGLTCRARAHAGAPTRELRAFSAEISALVTDILSDPQLRIMAFGPNNALMLPFEVAAKTGTSSDWKDNWAVGYTSRFTVAVWTGDFEGRSMDQLAGVTGAGPLFHRIMKYVQTRGPKQIRALADLPPAVEVCAVSGKRPSHLCPRTRRVHVQHDHLPAEICAWHQEKAIDRRNGLLAGERCPEEHVARRVFEILPARYAEWQAEHRTNAPPSKYSPHCPASGTTRGALVVTYPRANEVFLIEPGYERSHQTLELALEVDPPVPEAVWFVDGERYAAAAWPYRASWKLEPGKHTLVAEAAGRRTSPITFEVR